MSDKSKNNINYDGLIQDDIQIAGAGKVYNPIYNSKGFLISSNQIAVAVNKDSNGNYIPTGLSQAQLNRELLDKVNDLISNGGGSSSGGKQIKEIINYYLISDSINESDVVDSLNWSLTSPAVTNEKPYLWVRQTIYYEGTDDVDYNYFISGKAGDPGIDGTEVEYLYCITSEETDKPKNPTPENWENPNSDYQKSLDWGVNSLVIDINGQQLTYGDNVNSIWTDDPQTMLRETAPIEWYCVRKKISVKNVDSSNNVVSISSKWGRFSDPVIWARYSKDGAPGEPGNSIERIEKLYTVNNDENNFPDLPRTDREKFPQLDEFTEGKTWESLVIEKGISGWYSNSPATTNENKFLWELTVIYQSRGEISLKVALTGRKGDPGIDGTDIEYLYARCIEKPKKPTIDDDYQKPEWGIGSQVYNQSGEVISNVFWTDDPIGVDEINQKEWCCVRKKKVVDGISLWGDFSDVALWAKFGKSGKSIQRIEHKYLISDSATLNDKIEKAEDGEVGTNEDHKWYETSPNTTNQFRYLWRKTKTIIYSEDDDETVQNEAVTKTTWEFDMIGSLGEPGIDGETEEWIYTVTDKETIPGFKENYWLEEVNGKTYEDSDFIPNVPENSNYYWSDDIQEVTSEKPFGWRAKRTNSPSITNGVKKSNWGYFSDPKKYTQKGEDGLPGQDGIDGLTPETAFKSTVFTRSSVRLTESDTPSGGTWNEPWPDPLEQTTSSGVVILWSDGIPTGSDPLYASSKTFSSEGESGALQTDWSTPQLMADSADFDVAYSSQKEKPDAPKEHGSSHTGAWGNTAGEHTIWMATSTRKNGEWGAWQISRIKGEKGENGTSINIKKSYPDRDAFEDEWMDDERNWISPEGVSGYDSNSSFIVGQNLFVWEGEAWIDLGQFKGQDGKTQYLHIKYATSISKDSEGNVTEADWTDLNGEVPGDWMGIYSDETLEDPLTANLYKWSYVRGKDGFGYEYIYTLTENYLAPNCPNESNDDDSGKDGYVPSGWYDNPPSVNETYRFCWVCYRKKIDGSWSDFIGQKNGGESNGIASLWSKYSKENKFKSIVFRRSNTALTTAPVGGTYDCPIPDEWWDGIPEGTDPLYSSTAIFYEDSNESPEWTVPQLMADTADFDVAYYIGEGIPSSGPSGHGDHVDDELWSNHASTEVIWMATSNKTPGGEWSEWTISRIKGEDGETIYKSTVFTRAESDVDLSDVILSSSESNKGIPNSIEINDKTYLWSDGIPDMEDASRPVVWSATAMISSAEDEVIWQGPYKIADSDEFDVCYHDGIEGNDPPTAPDPTDHPTQSTNGWYNEAKSSAVWMATSNKKAGGNWSDWTVTRIKGEKGEPGDTGLSKFKSTVFRRTEENIVLGEIDKPSGGNYNSPIPDGDLWSDAIPEFDSSKPKLWSSSCTFSYNSNTKESTDEGWSVPLLMADSENFDVCYSASETKPTLKPQNHGSQNDDNGWYDLEHYTGNEDSLIWMATSTRSSGSTMWTDWKITRIKGETGKEGASKFISTVFTRAEDGVDLSSVQPFGGNYARPRPNDIEHNGKTYSWSDGIPEFSSEKPIIWSSKATLESNIHQGETQPTWSNPVKMSDSDTFDVCYHIETEDKNAPNAPSSHGVQTGTDGWWDLNEYLNSGQGVKSEDLVWMATASKRAGESWKNTEADWTITRIKGEKGDPGENGLSISTFTSVVFTRTSEDIILPEDLLISGGNYDSPIPNNTIYDGITLIWSDGIPNYSKETPKLWSTRGVFSNNILEDITWSAPQLMADVPDKLDIEYLSVETTNPGNPTNGDYKDQWTNEPGDNVIWMATRTKSGSDEWSSWTVTRVKGERGIDGSSPIFISTVFKRTALNITSVTTPSGGTYENPWPTKDIDGVLVQDTEWSDGLPEYDEKNPKIWMSKATFSIPKEGPLEGWSTPKMMMDSNDFDVCYHASNIIDGVETMPEAPQNHGSQNNDDGWYNEMPYGVEAIWMATSSRIAGSNSWTSWVITKIKGEKGDKGIDGVTPQAYFKSTVFLRVSEGEDAPNTPKGGTYSDPIPDVIDNVGNTTGAKWSDGIPSGVGGKIYSSTATFGSQETSSPDWSTPQLMADEPGKIDICYSPSKNKPTNNPSNHGTQTGDNDWYDLEEYLKLSGTSEDDLIWMATSSKNSGDNDWSNWVITKIRGEDGESGISVKIKKSYDTLAEFEEDWKSEGKWKNPNTIEGYDSGSSFIVGYNLYTWDGDSWEPVGQIKGQDGKAQYLHIKYASAITKNLNGEVTAITFTGPVVDGINTGEEPGEWMGTLVDSEEIGPEANVENWKEASWANIKGKDGFGYEYIYKTTVEYLSPEVPGDSINEDGYVPEGWSDEPISVDPKNKYCWTCHRTNKSTKDGSWGPWRGEKGEVDYTGFASLWDKYQENIQPNLLLNTGFDKFSLTDVNSLSPRINLIPNSWYSISFQAKGKCKLRLKVKSIDESATETTTPAPTPTTPFPGYTTTSFPIVDIEEKFVPFTELSNENKYYVEYWSGFDEDSKLSLITSVNEDLSEDLLGNIYSLAFNKEDVLDITKLFSTSRESSDEDPITHEGTHIIKDNVIIKSTELTNYKCQWDWDIDTRVNLGTDFLLTPGDYEQHSISFKTGNASNGKYIPVELEFNLIYRDSNENDGIFGGIDYSSYKDNQSLRIGMIKLEKNEVPTTWVKNESDNKAITAFKSTVFKRTSTNDIPTAPTGGDYNNPIPTDTTWSDGIPAADSSKSLLWSSSFTFYNDVDYISEVPMWSEPTIMMDTATMDVEWSSVGNDPGDPTDNPEMWGNTSNTDTIWMAVRYSDGAGGWTNWQISKIKGEKGNDGVDGKDGADGKNGKSPNENLLNNTSQFDADWTLGTVPIYKAAIVDGLDGHKALHITGTSKNQPVAKQTVLLTGGEWYTLSFLAKHNGTDTSQLGKVIGDGIIDTSEDVYVDGIVSHVEGLSGVKFTSDWKLYSFTFKTLATLPSVQTVSIYLAGVKTGLFLFQPKLERGKDATPWCTSESDRRGIAGPAGERGALLSHQGNYDPKVFYTLNRNDDGSIFSIPCVYLPAEGNGSYLTLKKDMEYSTTIDGVLYPYNPNTLQPIGPDDSEYWTITPYQEQVFTKFLMANYAQFGSEKGAVFFDRFLFSQYGVDKNGRFGHYLDYEDVMWDEDGSLSGEFTPSLAIDMYSGYIKANKIAETFAEYQYDYLPEGSSRYVNLYANEIDFNQTYNIKYNQHYADVCLLTMPLADDINTEPPFMAQADTAIDGLKSIVINRANMTWERSYRATVYEEGQSSGFTPFASIVAAANSSLLLCATPKLFHPYTWYVDGGVIYNDELSSPTGDIATGYFVVDGIVSNFLLIEPGMKAVLRSCRDTSDGKLYWYVENGSDFVSMPYTVYVKMPKVYDSDSSSLINVPTNISKWVNVGYEVSGYGAIKRHCFVSKSLYEIYEKLGGSLNIDVVMAEKDGFYDMEDVENWSWEKCVESVDVNDKHQE